MVGTSMFPSLLIIVKDLNEESSEENIKNEEDLEKIQKWSFEEAKEEDLDSMSYKEICSLCKGNGYITVVVKGQDEIKQCWLCESKGEKEYSQAEIDDFIYNMYYKKGEPNAV